MSKIINPDFPLNVSWKIPTVFALKSHKTFRVIPRETTPHVVTPYLARAHANDITAAVYYYAMYGRPSLDSVAL
jgi:hypothetical protein